MLDIINGKIVAKTEEGCFEMGTVETHRAITTHYLELMEDNNPDNIRANYLAAEKLYEIGGYIYKSEKITEAQTREDLMPLIDCIVKDTSERHLAALVMRYVTREYTYKIKTRYEVGSFYDFFYALRDPIFTLNLKEDRNTEMYHRVAHAFLTETNTYKDISTYSEETDYNRKHEFIWKETRNDIEFIKDDENRFKKAVHSNTPIPTTKPRDYAAVTSLLIVLPYIVYTWGQDLCTKRIFETADMKPLYSFGLLCKNARHNEFYEYDVHGSSFEYSLFQDKHRPMRQAFDMAKKEGFYGACYYIAQRIGSDRLRKQAAKAAGVTTKIPNYGNSLKRAIIRIIKLSLIIGALYIGYSILKAIYDFIDMPIVFWWLFLACIGGIGEGLHPETTESAFLLTTTSPYRRARYYQGKRIEQQLKDQNNLLREYNRSLSRTQTGYNYFK